MRIALINGSPKFRNSTSGALLEDMKYFINNEAETVEVDLNAQEVPEPEREELERSDVWLFSLPLYLDAVPGHLLSCLVQLEKLRPVCPEVRVYAIVNCGFYEGIQTQPAMEILSNWCARAGFVWGGGAGVGGGGGLSHMPGGRRGFGPKAPVERALDLLAAVITEGETHENIYVSVGLPRFLYRLGAQISWRKMLRNNGLKKEDLGKIPPRE